MSGTLISSDIDFEAKGKHTGYLRMPHSVHRSAYPPTLLRGLGYSPEESAKLIELQAAFDAPYAWVFTSGGGGAVSPEILALTERGIKRLLHSTGMLPAYKPDAANGTRELTIADSVIAYDNGLFEPYHRVENEVENGDVAGVINFPETPWRTPVPLTFQQGGMVLCQRVPGLAERGDCLFQVAKDLQA